MRLSRAVYFIQSGSVLLYFTLTKVSANTHLLNKQVAVKPFDPPTQNAINIALVLQTLLLKMCYSRVAYMLA